MLKNLLSDLKNRLLKTLALTLVVVGITAIASPADAQTRIRDLVTVSGVRSNPVYGYGIVIGLDGTGDQTTQTPFTSQSIVSMLQQSGITLPPGANMQLKNVASVMVTKGSGVSSHVSQSRLFSMSAVV